MLELQEAGLEQSEKFKEAVNEFEEKCKTRGVSLHGFLVLKGNNILAERYYFPYDRNTCHRMYSITKSLTSLAIGFLIDEGWVKLDDCIYAFFPERYEDNKLHPWFKELTIEDMLTMRTCFYKTTYKEYEDADWTQSYFEVKPDHKPGTVFSYDTSSSQVLAALVEKLTGMSLLDYLRVKVLDKIGFSKDAYILTDKSGTSQGGTGLNCTLRDIAKLAYVINNMGVIDGTEILPKEFLQAAVNKQVPTSVISNIDESCGYGYMFWRLRKNGFVMYGMGGQLAMCFPEHDICMITMADTIGTNAGLQTIYDTFYDTIYKCLMGKITLEKSTGTEIPLSEGEYIFKDTSLDFKSLLMDRKAGILTLTDNDDNSYSFTINTKKITLQKFSKENFKCTVESFEEMGHLIIKCYLTDYIQGHVFMDIFEKENSVTIRMESTSNIIFSRFKGCMTGIRTIK